MAIFLERRVKSASARQNREHLYEDIDEIELKVRNARKLSETYREGEAQLEQSMFILMQSAMDLHDKFITDGQVKSSLRTVLKKEKVKITKNTTSNFIPLMKLLAPNMPSSTRGRSAAILTYADLKGIRSEGVCDFIRDNGGIAKCARAASALKRPLREQKRAEKADTLLKQLRLSSLPLSALGSTFKLNDGLMVCLLEKRGDDIKVLALKSAESVIGFHPLEED